MQSYVDGEQMSGCQGLRWGGSDYKRAAWVKFWGLCNMLGNMYGAYMTVCICHNS